MDQKQIYRFKLYLHCPGMKPIPRWISDTGDLVEKDELSDRTLFWGTGEQARVEQLRRLGAHGDFLEDTNLEAYRERICQKDIPEKILKRLKGEAWQSKTMK